jgi:large repetitive protein
VKTLPTSGEVGATVIILGTDLTGATSVTFDGTAATFTVVSSSEITTTVPSGAATGEVQVTTPKGTLICNVNFRVTPTISDFSPTSGPAGTSVVITGEGFRGATCMSIGGVMATLHGGL